MEILSKILFLIGSKCRSTNPIHKLNNMRKKKHMKISTNSRYDSYYGTRCTVPLSTEINVTLLS